jgi:hypothetical protein
MLTQNLALDNSTGVEATFNLQKYLPDGALRIDVASTTTESKSLEIRHTSSGKGAASIDRHLISSYWTKPDVAGVPFKATVNLTLAVPRNAVFSNADILDLVAYVIDLISDGGFSGSGLAGTTNASAVLRGES